MQEVTIAAVAHLYIGQEITAVVVVVVVGWTAVDAGHLQFGHEAAANGNFGVARLNGCHHERWGRPLLFNNNGWFNFEKGWYGIVMMMMMMGMAGGIVQDKFLEFRRQGRRFLRVLSPRCGEEGVEVLTAVRRELVVGDKDRRTTLVQERIGRHDKTLIERRWQCRRCGSV